MTITNHMNLPQAIVDACQTEQHNRPGEYSITTLLQGTKQIVLTARHWDELSEDAADSIWKIFGTAVHSVLENSGSEGFQEERLTVDLDGVKVTGRLDLYDMANGIIHDYKTASVWKIIYADFSDWKQQGVGYGWLLAKSGLPVKGAQFTAILKDHKKSEARRGGDYPKSPVSVYKFAITDSDIYDFERFVREKIADIIKAESLPDDDIAPCTAAERWAKETTYAVMKPGRKTAVKVCATELEATNLSLETPGGYVETRPGDSVKCRDYCAVCDHCNFYKAFVKGE